MSQSVYDDVTALRLTFSIVTNTFDVSYRIFFINKNVNTFESNSIIIRLCSKSCEFFLWIVIIRKDEIKKRYANFQQSVIKNSLNIHQKQKVKGILII